MADKERDLRSEFHRIMDGIIEYLEHAPGEELLDDAAAVGEDPEETAACVRSILLDSVKSFEQRHLLEARKAYKEEVAALQQRSYFDLPPTPEGRRACLEAFLAKNQQVQKMVTTQFREFNELTDADVTSLLQQFADLGLLGDEAGSDEDAT